MNQDTKDILSVFVLALLSVISGGLFFYTWLLFKWLKEEC